MNFLKWLFGGGGTSNTSDGGYYLYVRPKMCKEIVRVRVNLTNDASANDDESGYILRKTASATRCPFQAEITLHLNKSRGIVDREISNGEFVTEGDYQSYLQEIEKANSSQTKDGSYPPIKQETAPSPKLNEVPLVNIKLLAQQLMQEDPSQFELQKTALETLAKSASPESVKIARNVIDKFENRSLVYLAMSALSNYKTDEAFAALIDMMFNHPKIANRGAAVLALGRTDDVRAIPPIKKMLSDGLISDEGLPIIDALQALSSMSGSRLRADEELGSVVNPWKERGGDYENLSQKITWTALKD